MSTAHLHLILNHIPLFGLLFGGGVLLYATLRRSDLAARIGLVFFIVAGLGAGGTYLTGEGAEELVEGQAGVIHSAIEAHEEVALYALLATAGLAAMALVLLFWFRRRSIPRFLNVILLALSLIAVSAVGYTAYTGGEINHPELRAETVQAEPESSTSEDDEH